VLQINENKAIGKTKKYAPYATGKAAKCKVCKSTLHQEGIYCHGCAYKKGKQTGSSLVYGSLMNSQTVARALELEV
jgi:hypothetical protein